MLCLDVNDGAFAALTAFYAIVHFTRDELSRAFIEARRVLASGGALLASWHVGDETISPADFLGEPCTIAWNFFVMADVIAAAASAGFTVEARIERAPYPGEHPSTRGYLLARNAGGSTKNGS